MKYSIAWINELISINKKFSNYKDLINFLNVKGLEVEEVQKVSEGAGDICLEIAIAPNRPDLLSHIGLARELSGLLDMPMNLHHLFSSQDFKKESIQLGVSKNKIVSAGQFATSLCVVKEKPLFTVKVSEPDLCSFYSARLIRNVQVRESPAWLKSRLQALGKKSINNIVDITNWILLEWGQPLHAFDWNVISGGIHVRKAKAKESLITLEEKEIQFYGDELIISDDERPLALAGVIGGLHSGTSQRTSDVLIEAAVFASYGVRRIARRFGLSTDSSFLFSKGVESQTVLLALNRACQLIQRLADGQVTQPIYRSGRAKLHKSKVMVSTHHLSQKLGYKVSLREFSQSMLMMNCEVQKKSSHQVLVTPPYYRKDLCIQEDFTEEWARFKGYDLVTEELPFISPEISLQNVKKNLEIDFLDQLVNLSKEQGYYQAINYSFSDIQFYQEFLSHYLDKEKLIVIKNPISQDLNTLRPSLLVGLFQNALRNIRRNQTVGRLFEEGIVFFKNREKDSLYEESQRLSFISWGMPNDLWKKKSFSGSVLLDLKSSVHDLCQRAGLDSLQWKETDLKIPFLHPKRQLNLLIQDQKAGWVGSLHPLWMDRYKLRQEIAMGEFDVSLLFAVRKRSFSFQKLSDFPVVTRDVSVWVPYDIEVGDVICCLKKQSPLFCKHISVVDYYESKELQVNQKNYRSVTFRFSFQGITATLSDQEISVSVEKMIDFLLKNLSILIR